MKKPAHLKSLAWSGLLIGLFVPMIPVLAGSLASAEIMVAPEAGPLKESSSVAVNANGDAVVIWQQHASSDDSAPRAIFGARYDASGAPIGAAFRISRQSSAAAPAVAMDEAGNFVVAWPAAKASGYAILARRYDSAAQPLDDEFVVDAGLSGSDRRGVAVARNGNGEFALVWNTSGQLAFGYSSVNPSGIRLRRYDALGRPKGLPQIVSRSIDNEIRGAGPHGEDFDPRVAMAPDGAIVVAWLHRDRYGTPVVFAQRYGAQGLRQGKSIQVSSDGTQVLSRDVFGSPTHYITSPKSDAEVAIDNAGRFSLTWLGSTRVDSTHYSEGVFMRRYGADGQPLAAEQLIVPRVSGQREPALPRIAMDGAGSAMVGWLDIQLSPAPSNRPLDHRVLVQRFDGNGMAVAAARQLSTTSQVRLTGLSLATRGPDTFAASWTSGSAGVLNGGRPVGDIKLVLCCSN